jgi:hypothetical protein
MKPGCDSNAAAISLEPWSELLSADGTLDALIVVVGTGATNGSDGL